MNVLNAIPAAAMPPLLTLLAYLLGSLSFAVIVSRGMGLSDPRTYGSKNPGATNVLRSGSKTAALLTLALDAFKGWLPVWAVQHWASALGVGEGTVALVALAAFVGHLFPIFFRFAGGKGVATALGVLVGIHPLLGLITAGIWIGVAVVFRYSSLAALIAAVCSPVVYAFGRDVLWISSDALFGVCVAMTLLLLWRHRDNINRLFAGKESKIGSKKS